MSSEVNMDVNQLLKENLTSIKLNILVFGPQVHTLSTDIDIRNLQNKRMEIRQELESRGHYVKYAEDLVLPEVNSFIQEKIIMNEFDFIVVILGQPGATVEAAMIANKTELSRKSSLYLNEEYKDGLVSEMCEAAQMLGAFYSTFKAPEDLVECHLLGSVMKKVKEIQFAKLTG